jgi:hypothetical protein
MRPNKISLRAKILLVVSAVVTSGFAACISVISIRSSDEQRAQAIQYATQLARTNSTTIGDQIDSTLETMANVSLALVAMKAQGVADRRAADELLKSVLASHASYLGIGTVWEPNAFDGKDADFTNAPATDKTGRYLTYWNRASGNIAVEACTDYDASGIDGEYYQKPRKTGQSLSVIARFARTGVPSGESVFKVFIAPAVAFITLAAVSVFALFHFDLVVGGNPGENTALEFVLAGALVVGIVLAMYFRSAKPHVYDGLGRAQRMLE